MKILSKIKKIIISIGIAMISLPKKIFAFDYNLLNEEMIAVQPAYGVPSPKNSIWYSIWSIAKVTLIPLALIIGLIIYFKKVKVQ